MCHFVDTQDVNIIFLRRYRIITTPFESFNVGHYFDGKNVTRIAYTSHTSRLKDCGASFIQTVSKLLIKNYFRHLRGDNICFDLRTYIFYLSRLATLFLQ